MYSIWN